MKKVERKFNENKKNFKAKLGSIMSCVVSGKCAQYTYLSHCVVQCHIALCQGNVFLALDCAHMCSYACSVSVIEGEYTSSSISVTWHDVAEGAVL